MCPRCSECCHLSDVNHHRDDQKHYCVARQDWRHPNEKAHDCRHRNQQYGFISNHSDTFHKRHGLTDERMSEKISSRLIRRIGFNTIQSLAHWCPGCKEMHDFTIVSPSTFGSRWTWNQEENKPTIRPEMKILWSKPEGLKRCHYFITEGYIEYFEDSTHWAGGKIIEMEDIPAQIWSAAGIE